MKKIISKIRAYADSVEMRRLEREVQKNAKYILVVCDD